MISIYLLVILHFLPWMFFPKSKIAHSPAKLIFLLSGITNIPCLLIFYYKPELSLNSGLMNDQEFYSYLNQFSILMSLSLLSIFLGIYLGMRIIPTNRLDFRESNDVYDGRLIRIYAIFCFLIGFGFILLKFSAAGGLTNFLLNIQLRSALLAGTAHYDILIVPATSFAVFMLIFSRSLDGKPSILTIFAVTILVVFLMSLFGGRKAPMTIVIIGLLMVSFYNPKVRLYSPVFLAGYCFIVFLFVAILYFRTNSQSDALLSDIDYISIIQNSSYLDTYLFILYHFSENDLWYGATFPELVGRFLPGFYSNGRPPLDDGVYIRTIYEGWYVEPGMPFADLYPSSWPPETLGAGYQNFGSVGVLIYSFIKGITSGVVYSIARKRNFDPISLYFLIYIAMFFHFTNLRIFQTTIVLFGLFLFSLAMRFTRKTRRS